MRFLLYILIILFLFISKVDHGQDADSLKPGCEVNPDASYFKSYFTDSWRIIASPSRWDDKQWIAASAVVGAGALAYWKDDEIRDLFQRNTGEHLDKAAKYFFEPLGRGYFCLSLSAGLYLAGELGKKKKLKETGLAAFKSVVLTSVFTYAIKYATQRHDPQADYPPDPRMWEGPFGSYRHTSFPSGHSAVIFTLASVISTAYKDRIWIPVMSYTLASLSAISRIYEDEHWSSDVIIGSALGFAIGKLVYKSTINCPDLVMIPGISATGHPGFTFLYRMR